MSILFISDLHLDQTRPDITALFQRFVDEQASDAQALYILGDLFEAWVGDDEVSALATTVRSALAKLTARGVPLYFLRGNRDFLVGPGFADDTGAQLLADPCVLPLFGENTLLMHGDLLCSNDANYQAFRRQVRDPNWQQDFLAQPLAARQAFAAKARAASQEHQAGLVEKNAREAITDVAPETVAATMALYGVTRLIHGHTHRPAIHALAVNGQPARRIVLGDWYAQGSVLRASADGFELAALQIG